MAWTKTRGFILQICMKATWTARLYAPPPLPRLNLWRKKPTFIRALRLQQKDT